MNKLIGAVVLFLISFEGVTQQLPKVYNQFFMNPYVYNPAYAGVEGHTVLFLTYKKQWLGIPDAPTLMNANFHIPLKGGISLGLLAYNETAGPLSQSAGKISTSYLISVDRTHFFRFGLSLGAGNNILDFDKIDSPVNDPAFANLIDDKYFYLGDFGVTYHFGHFNIGAALPNLFSYDLFTAESSIPIRVTPQDNLLFKMNFRAHLGDNLAIEPHVIYRYSKFLDDQYEGTLIFHIAHVIWLGGTYRQDAGYVGLAGVKIAEKIGIGYAFEYGDPEIADVALPSHEIHIGYHIGTKKHHADHISSFIKSHRKSAEERANEAELERQRKLQTLQENRQKENVEALILDQRAKQREEIKHNWNYEREPDPIVRTNRFGEPERGIKFDRTTESGEKEVVFSWLPPVPEGATSETYEIANPYDEPLIRSKPDGSREAGIKWKRTITGNDGEKIETLIIWDKIMTEEEAGEIDQNTTSKTMSLADAKIVINKEENNALPEQQQREYERSDPSLTDDFRTNEELAQSDEYLSVKRGNHMLELPAGNYIVGGVFENYYNASDFSDILFQKGYKGVKVGYVSARGYYYVVMFQSWDLEGLRMLRNEIRETTEFSNAWVLKIYE